MTRINCIPPRELTDKHLLAEYRELPRAITLANSMHEKNSRTHELYNATASYVLGTGHVKFFAVRLLYVCKRFKALVVEMQRRGFQPRYTEPPLARVPSEYFNDWKPTSADMILNRERIHQRLKEAEERKSK